MPHIPVSKQTHSLVKHKVGCEQHEQAKLIALASVATASDFKCQSSKTCSWDQHSNILWHTAKERLTLLLKSETYCSTKMYLAACTVIIFKFNSWERNAYWYLLKQWFRHIVYRRNMSVWNSLWWVFLPLSTVLFNYF